MDEVSQGRWIFAGVALLIFVIAMVFAYRRDLRAISDRYKRVWIIVVAILVIYFVIMWLNRSF